MVVEQARRLFTVDEYDRMVEAGIFHEDDRIELIEGEILEMSPIGDPHIGTVNRLAHLFIGRLGDRAVVSIQNPIALRPRSAPQPDVAVLRPRADFYGTAKAEPMDVLLLIEIADSSLTFDRRTKMPLYARHGIPEYWIVDVEADSVEVYRGPGPDGYEERAVLERGATISPHAFADLELWVEDLVGPA